MSKVNSEEQPCVDGVTVIVILYDEQSGWFGSTLRSIPYLRGKVEAHKQLVRARANPLEPGEYALHVNRTLSSMNLLAERICIFGPEIIEANVVSEFDKVNTSYQAAYYKSPKELSALLSPKTRLVAFFPDPIGVSASSVYKFLKRFDDRVLVISSRGRVLDLRSPRLYVSRFVARSRMLDVVLGALVVVVAVPIRMVRKVQGNG